MSEGTRTWEAFNTAIKEVYEAFRGVWNREISCAAQSTDLRAKSFILESCSTRTIKGGTYTSSSRSSIKELQETKNFFKQA